MRNLRDLIENQEEITGILKNNAKNEEILVDEVEETKLNIEKIKRNIVNSELVFPEIYTNKELYELALRINDSFLMNLL